MNNDELDDYLRRIEKEDKRTDILITFIMIWGIVISSILVCTFVIILMTKL